jgi:hypothetical protein
MLHKHESSTRKFVEMDKIVSCQWMSVDKLSARFSISILNQIPAISSIFQDCDTDKIKFC